MKSRFFLSLLCGAGFWIALLGWVATVTPLHAQPPTDLLVEGVPDLPDTLLQATAPYWKVATNVFMGWEPKSNAMLISSVNQGTRQLHVLLSPSGETRMATLFPEYIVAGSFMPKTGDEVVFASDHDGDEFYQLYGLDSVTGKTQLLTDGNSRNTNTIYDYTGKRIAYLSTMPEGKHNVIYVMNPRDPDSRQIILAPDNDGWQLQDWAHDGLHILAAHLTSRGGYLWSINTFTSETTLLTKTPETQQYYMEARYTPDDTGLYCIVLLPRGAATITYLPLLNGGPIRKIPQVVGTPIDMELSPDGTWLAYLTTDHSTEMLHFFNTLTGEELPDPSLAPAFFARMRWTDDSSELGFNYGSATAPFQAYSYKIPTRELVQWTTPQVDLPQTPTKPELVKIPSFDGLEISGYLYRPDPRKFPGKRPVLINIHGGPASEYLPGFLGPQEYYLDGMGVALFFPNVRGSTGFGADFVHLDDGYKREDSVKDIGAFLDWIATDPQLDSNRVGVTGGSYGGYMALATLFHYGNRVRCGSDIVGITDFVTFLRHTSLYRQTNRRYEYGDERYPDMNKFLESISPLNHVADIHDPVMITGGKSDPRVPVGESDQMAKAIRAQNGIVWYILGENEGHGFRIVSDEQYRFEAEAYFFQTYLLPEKRLTPLGPVSVEAKAAPAHASDASTSD